MRAGPRNGGVPGLLCVTKCSRRLVNAGWYPTTRSEARPVHLCTTRPTLIFPVAVVPGGSSEE